MKRRKKQNGKKPKRRRPINSADNPLEQMMDSDLDAPISLGLDDRGLHYLVPGRPESDTFERMTGVYQQNIRRSPLWDQMVKKFGVEKAEELLKQCRVEPD
jgi:hypothetical protein